MLLVFPLLISKAVTGPGKSDAGPTAVQEELEKLIWATFATAPPSSPMEPAAIKVS
jgi:hypothetical protein